MLLMPPGALQPPRWGRAGKRLALLPFASMSSFCGPSRNLALAHLAGPHPKLRGREGCCGAPGLSRVPATITLMLSPPRRRTEPHSPACL